MESSWLPPCVPLFSTCSVLFRAGPSSTGFIPRSTVPLLSMVLLVWSLLVQLSWCGTCTLPPCPVLGVLINKFYKRHLCLPQINFPSFFSFLAFFLCSCGRGSPGKSVTSTMRQGMILTWSPPELSDQDTHSLRDICNLLFKRALRVGLDQDSLSICQTTQAYKPCFWKVWIYSSCETCQPKMGKRFSHVYIFILKCSAVDQPC